MHRTRMMAVLAAFLILAPQAIWAQEDKSETYRQLKLFGDVFERVRADYVEEVSDEELIESAIRGMLSSLDPHSSYLDASSFQDMRFQTKGEFGGLGIEVTMEAGLVKVVSPIDDTPADRAGVKAGDFISHLDGDPVLGLTLAEAVEKMRGKINSDIVLTIRRPSRDPFDVTITRAIIKVQSVRHEVMNDVGYLRITSFNEQTSPGLKSAINQIKDEVGAGLLGYVLDLRNNPGGLLDEAVSVSDAFLDQGEIVSTRGRHSDDAQRFNSHEGDLTDGLPIVVLINSGSASASEIVAGALQDHRRAIIMGTDSFGKGSVQTIIPLAGHGAMRLTTARYFTPSGQSIQATGIEPDIYVAEATIESAEPARRRREADLRGALENPSGTNGDGATEEPDAEAGTEPDTETDTEADAESEDDEPEDFQLARAVDLLRGLALFNERVVN